MKEKKLKELEKSVDKLIAIEKKLNKNSGRTGIIRAVLFLSIVILIPTAYISFTLIPSLIFLAVLFTAFIIISIIQIRLLKFLKIIRNWIKIKKSFISRIIIDWENIEQRKLPDGIKQKLIETDLDLTGEKSLHQLIDFSISIEGSLCLRDFLINHNLNENEILKKQNIVKEILGLNKFREKFLLTLSLISKRQFDSKRFINWINKKSPITNFKSYLFLITFLTISNITFVILAITDILQYYWVFSLFLYFAFYNLGNKYYRGLSEDADIIKEELGKYSRIFEFIENYNFKNNKYLKELCSPFQNKAASPSQLLNNTMRIVSFLTMRANPFVWFGLILLFPFDFYLSYYLQKYKSKISQNFEKWTEIYYNLETYVSIANFAYLNQQYTFPKIIKGKFEFKVEEIGHPLINYQNRIKNSFEIKKVGEAFIITGSNMSGKSTFLRTLGINTCLAYAGAPVDANSFSISPIKIFTCIKVSDSVVDGISYFYSEVKRLKELLDLINNNKNESVFYLIDEIFKGTNNIERRKGSSAFIKSLIGKNCVGLISTHDIELVKLADDNNLISNFHFREEVQKDKMIFDYKLREGPCPTTNALKIMEIEGLPVND